MELSWDKLVPSPNELFEDGIDTLSLKEIWETCKSLSIDVFLPFVITQIVGVILLHYFLPLYGVSLFVVITAGVVINLVRKKWYWAIFNFAWFAWLNLPGLLPRAAFLAQGLDPFRVSIEILGGIAVVLFCIGSMERAILGIGAFIVLLFVGQYIPGLIPGMPTGGNNELLHNMWIRLWPEYILIFCYAALFILCELIGAWRYVQTAIAARKRENLRQQWTSRYGQLFQQQRNNTALPNIRTASEVQIRNQLPKFFHGISEIGKVISDVALLDSFISLLARAGASEEECQELLAWAKKAKQVSGIADVAVSVAKYLKQKYDKNEKEQILNEERKRLGLKPQKTVKDIAKESIAKYIEHELKAMEKPRIQQE